MNLRGLTFAIMISLFAVPATAQLCDISEAHLSKLQQTFAGMAASAANNPRPPCGVQGIIGKFHSDWENPAICGPEDVKRTCISDVENAITQNLPSGGFDTGSCDTQKQARSDLNNRGQRMKRANGTCEKKFSARRKSCKRMFLTTIQKVSKCTTEEIETAKNTIMEKAREGLDIYCKIINTHVKGLATQAKIEATSEQMSSRTIASCNK